MTNSIIDAREQPTIAVDLRLDVILPNKNVTVAGVEALPYPNGFYYCSPADTLSVSAGLKAQDGTPLLEISYVWPEGHPLEGQPMVLKLPFVRHAAGRATTDEVYLNATIVDGELTIWGKIPDVGGDWKILIDRCNVALKAIGAPFKVVSADITFLA
jgi:hypothetical protein